MRDLESHVEPTVEAPATETDREHELVTEQETELVEAS
jgi:hypothetical protein